MSRPIGGPRGGRRRPMAILTILAVALGWLVLVSPEAVADGPTTFSNTTAIAIPATGSADQMGPASPYPSDIPVSGLAGSVSKVTVTFSGLTHTSVADIDAMVVSPTGQNLIVLSDLGQPDQLVNASDVNLTFDDSAAGPVPGDKYQLVSGTYKPTNIDSGGPDVFPAPAPTPSNETTLSGAFTGINPNGTWHLYINDDTSGDVGTLAGGWSLSVTTEVAAAPTTTTVTTSDATSTTGDPVTFTASVKAGATPVTAGSVQFSDGGSALGSPKPLNGSGQAVLTTSALAEGTHLIRATYGGATGFLSSNGTVSQRVDNATVVTGNTFCNTGPMTIPELGQATPYPSHVTVSGLAGQVTKVTATLKDLSHQAPIDLDIMLAAPTPSKNLLIMSDAGGQSPVSNLNLTFDDDAAGPVPAPAVSGTYKPTNIDDGSSDTFPAPAPTPSSATTLSTFNGPSANGQWSLWVVDDASGDSGSIAGGWCLTVTSKAATSTTLTSAPNPSSHGSGVTLTATVASGGAPVTTGTVQFTDGATPIGGPVTVGSDGTATLTTSALTVGSHTLTAAYGGTDTLGESSGSATQVVDRAATKTVLTSDGTPSTVGDPVRFTATVTSAGVPVTTGTVQFTDGGSPLGAPVTVGPDGAATLTTSTLDAGTHEIAAAYSGDANLATSSDSLQQVVDKLATTTTLTSAPNPSDVGQPVTLTATVTSGGAPVTTGTVQFADGGSPLGAAVPVGPDGTATLSAPDLTAGSHTVSADYQSTPTYAGSTGSTTQVVNKLTTTTTLTSAPNPSDVGQPVTLTATVTSGGSPVTTGTVQFADGGSPLGAAVPVGPDGTATLSAPDLTAGSHTVSAAYQSTPTYAGSTGSTTQVVNKLATTTTLTSALNPSDAGQSVTFTATVTSGGAAVGAGDVTFAIDGIDQPAVPVGADGTAQLSTKALAPGTHAVTAAYSGTPTYADSASAPLEQDVRPVADAGGPYTVAEGGALTLDASGSTPGAIYAWDVNGDGDFTDATGAAPTLSWAQLEALGINDGPSDHTVTLQVTLGALVTTATADLKVTNTAPVAVVTGSLTATVGAPFTVKVGADDPSSADMAGLFTYTVNWGDGSPVETVTGPADPPVTHTYTSAGSFDAAFTATDKDGGTSGPTTVQVQAVASTPTTTTTTSTSTSSTTSSTSSTSTTGSTSTTTPPLTTSAPTQGGGTLAFTGSDLISPLLLGIALLAAGGLLVVAIRRRLTTDGRH